MKQISWLLAALVLPALCVGCESFEKWRDKQTKMARGEYKEPTGPVQQGSATQPLFKPRMLNDLREIDTDKPVILPDVMLVNGQTVRPADVLEPVWHRLERLAEQHPDDYMEQVRLVLRDRMQQTINEFLVWDEVKKKINTEMQEALDKAIDTEMRERINKEFGGSQAKLERYLSQRGMSLDEYKKLEGRRIAMHQYLREEILPQIRISRRQIHQYYLETRKRYETPSRIRLQMIELPFSEFVPAGKENDPVARLEAHEKAGDLAQKALDELKAGKDFAEVAKAYSKGVHAEQGGRWDWVSEDSGMAGRWEEPAKAAFALEGGRFSGLIETKDGFFIVRAEEKVEGQKKDFEEVQQELEKELRDLAFDQRSMQLLAKLWVKADLQGYEAFRNRLLTLVPVPGLRKSQAERAETQPGSD